jgi:predicted RNA binding protein YcfA (HicA-like mRNA interferase family)
MPPVPILKPRQVVKAFERLGWEIARQRGSHIILTKTGHIATLSVPNHAEVARGTLRTSSPEPVCRSMSFWAPWSGSPQTLRGAHPGPNP